MAMKIYFCASVRAGRQDLHIYRELIDHLKKFGVVLTEHLGEIELEKIETGMTDVEIHDKDVAWLLESDVVVAEVSTPSLGVGYEIGRAVALKKPILSIYRGERQPSAMIAGCRDLTFHSYTTADEAKAFIYRFLEPLRGKAGNARAT